MNLRIIMADIKERFTKKKYPKHPKSNTIYRPFRDWAQKDGRWNLWHDTFKRGIFYAVIGWVYKLIRKGMAWPVLARIKKFFKRHDTWPTDGNIPKTEWNHQFWILRQSYENAFNSWIKAYLWQGYRNQYPDFEEFKKMHYNSWSQKSIRWIIDFICLAGLEDTVYRELLAVWSFEHQKLMNKVFNPEYDQYHVFYCSYYDGDPRYFQIQQEIAKRRNVLPGQKDKIKRMTADHQKLVEEAQKEVLKRYEQGATDYLNKNKGKQSVPKKVIEKDVDMKDKKSWADIGKSIPDEVQGQVKGMSEKDLKLIIKKIPEIKKGEIVVLSVPGATAQSMDRLHNLIRAKKQGEGDIILINKEYDAMVFKDIKELIKQGKV